MLSVCVCVVVAAVAWRQYENSRWFSRDLSFCRAPKVGRGGEGGVCVLSWAHDRYKYEEYWVCHMRDGMLCASTSNTD